MTDCHDCGTPTDYREADEDGRCPRCQERSNVTCPECLEHYQHHAPKCRIGASERRQRMVLAFAPGADEPEEADII